MATREPGRNDVTKMKSTTPQQAFDFAQANVTRLRLVKGYRGKNPPLKELLMITITYNVKEISQATRNQIQGVWPGKRHENRIRRGTFVIRNDLRNALS